MEGVGVLWGQRRWGWGYYRVREGGGGGIVGSEKVVVGVL